MNIVKQHKYSSTKNETLKNIPPSVPHVVDFYGSFQDSKQMYIVMEFCSRGDLLENILREGQAMEEQRTIKEVKHTSSLQWFRAFAIA